MAIASELATHGAAHGGVVCEKAGVVDSPHEFLFVCELDICEGGVLFVVREIGAVLRVAGEEGSVFGCLRERCVCVCLVL